MGEETDQLIGMLTGDMKYSNTFCCVNIIFESSLLDACCMLSLLESVVYVYTYVVAPVLSVSILKS